MTRPKLSIDEQITDMQTKGITFHHSDKDNAKRFLKYNTYYFKIKAYERNYDKYNATPKKGQYINLDFAYLKELSTLDMYLRKTILSMALDIEHALKVQFLYELTQNPLEDGYTIVEEFLMQDFTTVKIIHNKIGKSATSDLIQKRLNEDDNYSLWEIVVVLSFGHFIDLYQLYYAKYPSKNKDILFEISKIKTISEKSRATWMKNPVVHDFIILVYVYLNVIKSSGIKQHGIEQLHWLFHDRMLRHKEYFSKNINIKECYHFTNKVITTLCNKYRK